VQQNASLVEEASAATESMKDQAALLLQAVSRFQLGQEPQPQPVRRIVEPAQLAPSPIKPIKVKPAAAALPPAYSTSQWQEF
jgi:hypothetical protein